MPSVPVIIDEVPEYIVALFHGQERATYIERVPNRAALYVHLFAGAQKVYTFRAGSVGEAADRAVALWYAGAPVVYCCGCGCRTHVIAQDVGGETLLYVTCRNRACERLYGQTLSVADYPVNAARYGTKVST